MSSTFTTNLFILPTVVNNPTTHPAPQAAANIQAVAPPNNPIDSLNLLNFTISDSSDTESEPCDEDDANESNESEDDSYLEDEDSRKENAAANAWLAKYPGGSRFLYPQLFVVELRKGKVTTPCRNPENPCFLSCLPLEIRNEIYRNCFQDEHENDEYPDDKLTVVRDRNGRVIQRLHLSSDNNELKFWLSNSLLQTSRQLRSEAMPILFENRVFIVEWLPALPRFVSFLGMKGCAMVRYLNVWDTLNVRGHEFDKYRDIITNVSHFPSLQHLRLVLSRGLQELRHPWFDASDWTYDGELKQNATPKMRFEDIKSLWPDYEVLKNLKAQKFILAVESLRDDEQFIVFDKNYGAYPVLTESIQFHPGSTEPAPSLAPRSAPYISPENLSASDAMESQRLSSILTPSSEDEDSESVNSDSPTWQDTDNLVSKNVPLYNFIIDLFHNGIYPRLSDERREETSVQDLVMFPTARKSTGSIMRDCAFCYLDQRHCGYHAMPYHSRLKRKRLGQDEIEEQGFFMMMQFENLSYVNMREACRLMDQLICEFGRSDMPEAVKSLVDHLFKAFTVFECQDWFPLPINEKLEGLDAAAEVGWTGRWVDKEEVPPWDMMYRQMLTSFRPHW